MTLGAEDLDRVVTWIDLNAPYYPTYASAYPDNLAGRSPLSNAQVQRLEKLTGVPVSSYLGCSVNPGPQVSFERPELSPCLASLKASDAAWGEAVDIIRAGAETLAKVPRGDGGEMQACAVDRGREEKYQARQREEARNRAALRDGGKAYDATHP